MAMLPTSLILGLGDIELGDDELAVAHAIELLGLGEDLAGGGDAEVVVGEELVHGGNVVGEGGLLPFVLERDDLGAFGALVLTVLLLLWAEACGRAATRRAAITTSNMRIGSRRNMGVPDVRPEIEATSKRFVTTA